MEFEWDEGKRQSNLKKHGIDFARACKIFRGETIDYEDTRNYNEQRFIAIGETGGLILTVVYTYRNEIIRIISARRANKNEKRIYYQSFLG
ncbi:MAG: BrnT family toxin [Halothece sp. Uz-M2-17]|nr:BrnT family toxin [Halothece sp. Uz-M2-17]